MFSKSINSVIAVFFAVVFLTPSWLQLEHSFHKHEDTHLCNAKGNTKHIHQESNNDCRYLHEQLNFHYTIEIAAFVFSPPTNFYDKVFQEVNRISLQAVSFLKLRAPPSLLF